MAKAKKHFLIGVNNTGREASLECRKIYQAVPDAAAARLRLIRIVDESGAGRLTTDSTVSGPGSISSQR
jgi:hypothetical protein